MLLSFSVQICFDNSVVIINLKLEFYDFYFFLVLFSRFHGNYGFDKFVSMPHLLLLFMYDLTLLMGNMIKPRCGLHAKGLFHKIPELFGPFWGASIAFLPSQRCGSKSSIKTSQSSWIFLP